MRGEIRYRLIASMSENKSVFCLTEECLRWSEVKPDLEDVHTWCRENGLIVFEFMHYLTMSSDDAVLFRMRWC